MGNSWSGLQFSRANRSSRIIRGSASSTISTTAATGPQPPVRTMFREARFSNHSLRGQKFTTLDQRIQLLLGGKADWNWKFESQEEIYYKVTEALRNGGLESLKLILGIDFTESNERTGRQSINNKSLHAIGDTPNPYEKVISIIGKTLAPFDDDNLIPCFGFGDATTHDQEIFNFYSDGSPCHGFEEVLASYRKIVPQVKLAGPTSYGPVIEAAINIVEKNGGQFHVLVIIADGQVTRSVSTGNGELSPQEQKTIQAIVDASSHALSIIVIEVGGGPRDCQKKFNDKILAHNFDNFQFVNFTGIMSQNTSSSQKEAAFAWAALMQMPFQYKAAIELGTLGRVTGKETKINAQPPPVLDSRLVPPTLTLRSMPSLGDERTEMLCLICLTNEKDLAFQCGHMTCRDCGSRLSNCHICREWITNRLEVFTERRKNPQPPLIPYSQLVPVARVLSNVPALGDERTEMVCPICLTNGKDLAFQCGHMTCRDCGSRVNNCPICREQITNRLRVFSG